MTTADMAVILSFHIAATISSNLILPLTRGSHGLLQPDTLVQLIIPCSHAPRKNKQPTLTEAMAGHCSP